MMLLSPVTTARADFGNSALFSNTDHGYCQRSCENMSYYTNEGSSCWVRFDLGRWSVKASCGEKPVSHFEFSKLNNGSRKMRGKAGDWAALGSHIIQPWLIRLIGYDLTSRQSLWCSIRFMRIWLFQHENRRGESAHKFYCVYASRFDEKIRAIAASGRSRAGNLAQIVMEERGCWISSASSYG